MSCTSTVPGRSAVASQVPSGAERRANDVATHDAGRADRRIDCPDPGDTVEGLGEEPPAIGSKHHAAHRGIVTEAHDLSRRLEIPQRDLMVSAGRPAGGGEPPAVGPKIRVLGAPTVPKHQDLRAGGRIPDARRAVRGRSDEAAPIRAQPCVVELSRDGQGQRGPALEIPQPYGKATEGEQPAATRVDMGGRDGVVQIGRRSRIQVPDPDDAVGGGGH
jgi:hypothetical protein